MTEERKIQLVAEVDTRKTRDGFNEIGQQAEGMAAKVETAGNRAQKAVSNIGEGADRSSAKVDAAQRNLIGSIQRTTAAMEAGSKTSAQYYEVLARQRGVDTSALAPYLAQLRAIESAQKGAGASAAQTAAALRGVPAQITDIVTSLQGGQQPLTVLLQQGGQLRDMFGSVGGAARALGSTILGMINPFTVLAAAAVAVAVAYHQGSKEAEAYNRSLITTGNVAGTTANQLADMAGAIKAAGVGTKGIAAEALAELVGTGKVQKENLELLASTAVRVQKTIGTSLKDTAGEFADLGRAPLQTIDKLNEKQNFLTSTVYAQIKALQDLGKTDEAGALAQRTYAEALNERATRIQQNLGTMEKAWNGVANFAKGAWDAMLDIGRPDTLQEKLEKAQKNLESAQRNRFSFINGGKVGAAQAEVDRIQAQIRGEERLAELDREKIRFNNADIAWQKQGEEFLTRRQQLEREIAKTRQSGLDAGVSDQDINARIAAIKEKYADTFKDGIESQIELVKRRGGIEEEVARRSMDLLNANRSAGLVNEREYLQAVAALEEAAFVREKARLKEELELTKGKKDSLKDQAALRGQIAAVDEKSLSRRLQLANELAVLEQKEVRAGINALADLVEKRDVDNAALEKQIQAQKDANAQIGLNKEQVDALNQALLEEAATRKEVEASILDTIVGREEEAEALRKNAKLLRELGQVQREGLIKREQFDRQREFWISIEDAAHQAFRSITEGGKNAAQRLRDSFKAIFFDWLYQQTVKKWIVNVSGQASGMSLFGGTSSGGSAFGGASDLFSTGRMIYQGFSSGIASSLGGIVSQIGNLFGSQAVSSFGAGLGLTSTQASAASSAFAAAGNTTAAGGISAGSSAASAIPVAGWIAAGMSLANGLFKQGYDPNNGTISKTALPLPLVAESLLGNKLLQAIGLNSKTANLLSGASLVTALFGRKNPQITSQGIAGTVSAEGFSGQQFADILQKGGLFRSDKRSTVTQALSAEQDTSFDDTIKAMIVAVKGFGGALGLQTDVIDGYSKQIKITLTNDEEKNKEAIAAAFGGISDDLSKLLLPAIDKFQIAGETAGTTLQRLAGDFASVSQALAGIGGDAKKAFGGVGEASIAATERLIQLAGGLDAFVSQTDFFAQNFLSDAQRIAPVQKQVTEALAALGYSSLSTVDQFREAILALQDSGALATEAGAKAFSGLLAIAPQFKQVADYLDAVKKAADELAASDAAAKAAAAREAERVAAERAAEHFRHLADALEQTRGAAQDAFGVLSSAIDREKQAVTSRYSGIISGLSSSIDSLQQAIQRTKNIIGIARDAFNSFVLPGQEAAARAAARQRLSDIAKNPILPEEEVIRQAVADATQVNEADFANAFEFEKASAQTRNDLLAIGESAEKQLDSQEQSLEVVKQWKALYEEQQAAELAALDKQLATAQQQLNALLGIEGGIVSLSKAQASFSSMVALAQNTATTNNPNATGLTLTQLYQSALGRAPDAAGYAFWQKQFGDTIDANEVKQFIAGASAELSGQRSAAAPSASVDMMPPWTKVGYVFTPPPAVSSAMAVPQTWSGVEAKLDNLQTTMETSMANLVTSSKSTADTLEQFNLQGLPAERT